MHFTHLKLYQNISLTTFIRPSLAARKFKKSNKSFKKLTMNQYTNAPMDMNNFYVAPMFVSNNHYTQHSPYIGLQYGPPPAAVPTIIQLPSLCLPRIYFDFDEAYINNVFLNMFGHTTIDGQSPVHRIDIVPREDRKTGEPFNVVFVHFKKTTINNAFIQSFTQQLNQGQELRIYYNHPWFWKVRKSDSPMPKHNSSTKSQAPKSILSPEEEQEILAYQKQITLSNNQEEDDDPDMPDLISDSDNEYDEDAEVNP
jgi:hypothetical protein